MNHPPGIRIVRWSKWLFGARPTQRFVEPMVADHQAMWFEAKGSGGASPSSLGLWWAWLQVVPTLLVRCGGDAMLALLVPLAVLAGLGVGLLAQSNPGQARLQLAWLGVGALVAIGVAALARRLRWPSLAVATLILLAHSLPVLLGGSAFVRFGLLRLDWPGLTLPLLLIGAVALAHHSARAPVTASALWCASLTLVVGASLVAAALGPALAGIAVMFTVALRSPGLRRGAALAVGVGVVVAFAWATWVHAPGAPGFALSGGSHEADLDVGADPSSLALRALLSRAGPIGPILMLVMFAGVAAATIRARPAGLECTFAWSVAAALGATVLAHAAAVVGVAPWYAATLPMVGYGGSAVVGLAAALACARSIAPLSAAHSHDCKSVGAE